MNRNYVTRLRQKGQKRGKSNISILRQLSYRRSDGLKEVVEEAIRPYDSCWKIVEWLSGPASCVEKFTQRNAFTATFLREISLIKKVF